MARGMSCRMTTAILAVPSLLAGGFAASTSAPVHATVAQAPQSQAGDTCPAVVVVAARGNEFSHEVPSFLPDGEVSWESNGADNVRLSNFLSQADHRFEEQAGESLMDDVFVLGLPAEHFPADIPLPAQPEGLEILTMIPHVGQIASDIGRALWDGVTTGTVGAKTVIEDYEAETGCTPQYILLGFSLGAMVLPPQEQWLAERGQLAGAIYVGSPLQAPGKGLVVGVPWDTRGVLGHLPPPPGYPAQSDNRIYYCLTDDVVCDPSTTAIDTALADEAGGPHDDYFDPAELGQPNPDLELISDTFAEWVTQAQNS